MWRIHAKSGVNITEMEVAVSLRGTFVECANWSHLVIFGHISCRIPQVMFHLYRTERSCGNYNGDK